MFREKYYKVLPKESCSWTEIRVFRRHYFIFQSNTVILTNPMPLQDDGGEGGEEAGVAPGYFLVV